MQQSVIVGRRGCRVASGPPRPTTCHQAVVRPTRASSSAISRVRGRTLRLEVALHGSPHGATKFDANAEKNKGFINEMRMVAMKLHTRDQAPKEGGQPAVQRAWMPTIPGYVSFLSESRAVYNVMERIVSEAAQPEYALLQRSGLERSAALDKDLAWFHEQHNMDAPPIAADGPSANYCALLEGLAKTDPPAFVCHYYNFYFAHTAGGKMIGGKISQMLLENHALEFYKYDTDVSGLLDAVRLKLNTLAENWSREQKDHCLAETAASFKYSGAILQCINGAPQV